MGSTRRLRLGASVDSGGRASPLCRMALRCAGGYSASDERSGRRANRGEMRFRTWPVLAFALGGLLLLIVLSVLAARTRARAIFAQLDTVSAQHRKVDI